MGQVLAVDKIKITINKYNIFTVFNSAITLSKTAYAEYIVFKRNHNNFTIYFSFPLIFYIEIEVSLFSKEGNSLTLSNLG